MALPLINESPKYKVKIPSTGKEVFYRPFYVKEQKVLLMALETQDQELILKAMIDTIVSCIGEKIDPSSLATFDVEYMFTKIRSKSVGETADIRINCAECETPNEVKVNLESITMDVPNKIPDIKLNDKYILVMRYPKYTSMIDSLRGQNKLTMTDILFQMVIGSLDKLLTDEDAILFDEESVEEKTKFLDNLNAEQFKEIVAFVQGMPKLEHDVHFNCKHCNHENKQTLRGIQDFF
jgi:transcription elongation factor Elf1